jgi:selenocysteine-specific elongation factor
LKLPAAVFNPLVSEAAAMDLLVEEEALVRAPGHEVRFTPEQETTIATLMRRFDAAGVNSPSVKESKAAVGEDVYFALVDLDRLRPLSNDVVYTKAEYERLVARIKQYLQEHGRIDAGQTRDLLDTSRKYAIALLEHLDEVKVTRRVGDERELV